MNGDAFGPVEMARRMAESTLDGAKKSCDAMFDDTKRACDALFDKAQKNSFALLDDTKLKCDKMIDEAGDVAIGIMKEKFRSMIALFVSGTVVLLVATFALGYFAGKG